MQLEETLVAGSLLFSQKHYSNLVIAKRKLQPCQKSASLIVELPDSNYFMISLQDGSDKQNRFLFGFYTA